MRYLYPSYLLKCSNAIARVQITRLYQYVYFRINILNVHCQRSYKSLCEFIGLQPWGMGITFTSLRYQS